MRAYDTQIKLNEASVSRARNNSCEEAMITKQSTVDYTWLHNAPTHLYVQIVFGGVENF